jgi:hypothetical protein
MRLHPLSLSSGPGTSSPIETAADAYSKRIDKNLPPEARKQLHDVGANVGDHVMELPPGEERREPWKSNPSVLARSPESRAVLYGALDESDYVHYVRIDRGDRPSRELLKELERWKPLLERRAEISRNSKRKWWETAWPRNAKELAAPKVIALFRTDRGRFALDEVGDWKPGKKLTVVVGKETKAPVAYLCGLLNSELLDLWYAVRGKTPWHVRRNYEPKRMNEIPYRRPDGDPRADQIAERARAITANRQQLLPHRPFVHDLTRIVKDPWKDGPVIVDDAALLESLPAADTVSVRLDLELEVVGTPRGHASRTAPGVLTFRRGGAETGRIQGAPAKLDLLEAIVGKRSLEDVEPLALPKDLDAFDRLKGDRTEVVRKLLADGRCLVEEVERLVCALYDVPKDLTDAVVEHAINRAGTSQPDEN